MEFKLNKSAFSVGRLGDDSDEKHYWLSKTSEERLQALEFLRQMNYGYPPSAPRLQRVFEVVQLERR
jgi:hypothetical protein